MLTGNIDPNAAYAGPPKQWRTATATWLFFIFLGGFSAHYFYLGGYNGRAVARLLTFQYFGVGWIIDLFVLNRRIAEANQRIAIGVQA